MARKYDRRSLAFSLADLGEELGRPPRPSDLKKGMPSRSTYARYFENWDEALEYAGYTEVSITPSIGEEPIQIINLLGERALLTGPDGAEILNSDGRVKVFQGRLRTPPVAQKLAPYVAGQIVTAYRTCDIGVINADGQRGVFPSYKAGVYYIVPECIARSIATSRTTTDLLYPDKSDSHYENGVMCISTLRMIYADELFLEESDQ